MSKLKDKWVREFDSLINFFKDSIRTWTVDYVKLNNNIFVIISEARDEVIKIKKKIFEMKIKHEIVVPPLRNFIND